MNGLVVALALAAAAPQQSGLRYGSGQNPVEPVAAMADAALVQQLTGLMGPQKIAKLERGGKAVSAADLTHAEKIAVVAVLQRAGAVGSETDLLVQGTPVTVWIDLTGNLSIASGAPVKDLGPPPATAAELAEKYHLDPFTADGAEWKPAELAIIGRALSLLTPEELALFGGVGFRRKTTDPQGRSAFYRRADDGMTVDVFDKSFAFDREYFIGSPDAPVVQSLCMVLHEMGHAISDFNGRQKAIAANKLVAEARAAIEKAKASPSNEATAAANALAAQAKAARTENNAADRAMISKGRPAERAFAAVVDPKASVTVYGRTSIDENLAEGFWLSKLDPAALERLSPAAVKWFAAGSFATEAKK